MATFTSIGFVPQYIKFKTIAGGLNSDDARREPIFPAETPLRVSRTGKWFDSSVNQKTPAKQTPATYATTGPRACPPQPPNHAPPPRGLCAWWTASSGRAGTARAAPRQRQYIVALWSVSGQVLVTSQSASVLAAQIRPYFNLISGHATCSVGIAHKKALREVREKLQRFQRRVQQIASIVSRCRRGNVRMTRGDAQ